MRFTPAAANAATVNDFPLIPTIKLNGFSVAPTFVADRFVVNNPNVQTVTFGINYLFH